jgi:hypothetical protein
MISSIEANSHHGPKLAVQTPHEIGSELT